MVILLDMLGEEYKSGKRKICGVPMPDGMVENQKFDNPIINTNNKS